MRYYSTLQPIAPGTYPIYYSHNRVVKIFVDYQKTFYKDISQEAWGYIDYQRPIPAEDAAAYGLMPPLNNIIKMAYVGCDSRKREVFKDQSGKLWKYAEPGSMPRERHDDLYHSSDNEMDGEPDWPLGPDMDYQIVEQQ